MWQDSKDTIESLCSVGIYCWACSLPSSVLCLPSETPLEKMKLSSARSCPLETASGLGPAHFTSSTLSDTEPPGLCVLCCLGPFSTCRSSYRLLLASAWVLEMEPRTFGGTVSLPTHWAVSTGQQQPFHSWFLLLSNSRHSGYGSPFSLLLS